MLWHSTHRYYHMIEVEKKFLLQPTDIEKLTAGAEFLKTITFTDVYYDSTDYALTRKDTWLRRRDARWELKISLSDAATRAADQYRELETEEEIADYLWLSRSGTFPEQLKAAGYEPFAKITTTRKKYRSGEFIIDIDSVDYGYQLAEIELMVASETEMNSAAQKILAFAKRFGIVPTKVRGKVLEYLYRYNKEHYQALAKAWVAFPN